MYHYNLRITTCALTKEQIEALKSVPPLENFTHEFHAVEELKKEDYVVSDIYIYGGSVTPEVTKELTQLKKSNSTYLSILLYHQDLLKDDFSLGILTDALWPKEVTTVALQGFFLRALNNIKRFCDKELYANYLNSLINNMPDMVWFKDLNGIHRKVNKKFCQVVGKDMADVEGKDHCYIWNLTPEEYAKGEFVCMETERPVIEQKKSFMFDEQVKYGDRLHYLNTYKSPIFDIDGKVIGTVGYARDITELMDSKREQKMILEALPLAAILYDENDKIAAINSLMCTGLKLKAEDVIGKAGYAVQSNLLPDLYVTKTIKVDEDTIQYEYTEKRDEVRHYRGYSKILRGLDRNKVGSILVLSDISAEMREIEQKSRLSVTDALTGVYNRLYYRNLAEIFVQEQANVTLAMVDLDRLKQVNDNYGHEKGDVFIIKAADLLKKYCGKTGQVCRIGGDEFALFMENINAEEMEKLMEDMSKELLKLQLDFPIGVSYGIAQGKIKTFEDFRELICAADSKLYIMKKGKISSLNHE